MRLAPLAGFDAWLKRQLRRGVLLDPKLHLGLNLAARHARVAT